MTRELPDVLDLLRVAVEAGLPPLRALGDVGRRHPGLLARELATAAGQAALGVPRDDALAALRRRAPLAGRRRADRRDRPRRAPRRAARPRPPRAGHAGARRRRARRHRARRPGRAEDPARRRAAARARGAAARRGRGRRGARCRASGRPTTSRPRPTSPSRLPPATIVVNARRYGCALRYSRVVGDAEALDELEHRREVEEEHRLDVVAERVGRLLEAVVVAERLRGLDRRAQRRLADRGDELLAGRGQDHLRRALAEPELDAGVDARRVAQRAHLRALLLEEPPDLRDRRARLGRVLGLDDQRAADVGDRRAAHEQRRVAHPAEQVLAQVDAAALAQLVEDLLEVDAAERAERADLLEELIDPPADVADAQRQPAVGRQRGHRRPGVARVRRRGLRRSQRRRLDREARLLGADLGRRRPAELAGEQLADARRRGAVHRAAGGDRVDQGVGVDVDRRERVAAGLVEHLLEVLVLGQRVARALGGVDDRLERALGADDREVLDRARDLAALEDVVLSRPGRSARPACARPCPAWRRPRSVSLAAITTAPWGLPCSPTEVRNGAEALAEPGVDVLVERDALVLGRVVEEPLELGAHVVGAQDLLQQRLGLLALVAVGADDDLDVQRRGARGRRRPGRRPGRCRPRRSR